MFRIFAAAVFAFVLFSVSSAAFADAPLTFHVFRKGEDIGTQVISFDRQGDTVKVTTTTRIAVKVLFVTAYKFTFDGMETWKAGKLVALDAHTNDNGEKHAVSVAQKDGKLVLTADGKSQDIPADTMPGDWWNEKLTASKELLDVLTGKIQAVTVKRAGSEKVKAGGADVTADHYTISGGMQRDLWYKPDGTLVRQTLVKKGDVIEYAVK